MDIVKEIGVPAMLGQLAEECAELAQAALKCQRILMGTNPTPVKMEDAAANLSEEMTDVLLCMALIEDAKIAETSMVMAAKKRLRWQGRIDGAKHEA